VPHHLNDRVEGGLVASVQPGLESRVLSWPHDPLRDHTPAMLWVEEYSMRPRDGAFAAHRLVPHVDATRSQHVEDCMRA